MTNAFNNQRILIKGAARSGIAAAELLRPLAAAIAIADDAPHPVIEQRLGERISGFTLMPDGEFPESFDEWDMIVVSPGVPTEHVHVQRAKAAGIPVLSELEVGARFIQGKLIAITGTNGKTTTASLTAHLLGGEVDGVFLAGNVGRALCEVMQSERARSSEAILVVEVSSFQCEHLVDFHPHIAIVLNLRPDHLDRHGKMDAYRAAKAEMGRNMTSDDWVLVNGDEPDAMHVVEAWKGHRIPLSRSEPKSDGAWCDDGRLVLRHGDCETQLLTREDIALVGEHNVSNTLAAAVAAHLCGVGSDTIAKRSRSFPGVPHRIEHIAQIDGVDYFNDSKSTNLDSLATALRSFTRPVVLIAGGRSKREDPATIADLIREHVRCLIVIGEVADELMVLWDEGCLAERALTLPAAVQRTRELANSGDAVLLSPGFPSFDMFRDFEDRGEIFRRAVNALRGGESAHA